MTIHSSILVWRTLWTEDPDGFHGGLKESDTTATNIHMHRVVCEDSCDI